MKKLLVIIFLVPTLSYAQDFNFLNNREICETQDVLRPAPVEKFKKKLKLTAKIDTVYYGSRTTVTSIVYSEEIENESKIILLTDDIAFSVSISKVIDNGDNFYIYALHLYRKTEGCWKESASRTPYDMFYPGYVTSGMNFTDNGVYVGFHGDIYIE